MDIVYTLGTGSKWRNNEIRYSLRSVEKHLKGYGNVFIVGECPDFVKNVIHIPCKDVPFRKEFSIYSKIMAAVNDDRVSDSFIFMNDDHFLCDDIHVNDFKSWYDGNLEDYKRSGHYGDAIKNTKEFLNDIFPLNYVYADIHTPIIYQKHVWDIISGMIDHKKEYVLKSLYVGVCSGVLSPMKDLKINKPMTVDEITSKLHGRTFWSIGDYAVNSHLRTVMEMLYPKSKYE